MHESVLLEEAVDSLVANPEGLYIDGTFGRGGHSREILRRLGAQGRLLAFDKDPEAVAAGEQLMQEDPRFVIKHASFADMASCLAEGIEGFPAHGAISGILLDLGVSSPQLDQAQRGFSFMLDGPLDMRMNPQQGESVAEWLSHASLEDIARVIKTYGEEKFGRRIATAIVEQRQQQPIQTTGQLARIIAAAMPVKEKHKHPATRTFQALRIYINNELDDIKSVLDQSLEALCVGGRLVVISFHSLEDRIVKRFIRDQQRGQDVPRGVPLTQDQLHSRLRAVGKAVKAEEQEVQENVRARSAIMRVAEKLA